MKMKTAALVLFTLSGAGAGAAFGEECSFVSENDAKLSFPSPVALTLDTGADIIECSTSSGGTGVATRIAHCDDGYEGPVSSASSVKGSGSYDLVIFQNELWYRTCS